MTDVHDKETRSYNMSWVKGKDTKPEMMVRKYLFANGFRYRLHDKKLPGKPDIVLAKYNTIIFVHGCFWHGHEGCKYYTIPKTRTDCWTEKIEKNKYLYKINEDKLIEMGYRVITIWECDIKINKKGTTLNNLLSLFG